jgi:hypothetical protein
LGTTSPEATYWRLIGFLLTIYPYCYSIIREILLSQWFRRKTMSLSKSIVFTALFCLLFCTPELYALGSNELKLEKQKTIFSLEGLGQSLSGTVNGIGKSLNGTVMGIGQSLGGTMDGIGEFLEENGETILLAGAVALFVIADCSYYDSGYYDGCDHGYHRK